MNAMIVLWLFFRALRWLAWIGLLPRLRLCMGGRIPRRIGLGLDARLMAAALLGWLALRIRLRLRTSARLVLSLPLIRRLALRLRLVAGLAALSLL